MIKIRTTRAEDLLDVQTCNLQCLPENYQIKYYFYHYLSWPQLLFVAVDKRNHVVGYVLAKMEEEDNEALRHGHVTSLAVKREYRKAGVASRLMRASQRQMKAVFGAHHASLHVRRSNSAAFNLYNRSLGYRIHLLDIGYYADGEDAYEMRLTLDDEGPALGVGTTMVPAAQEKEKEKPAARKPKFKKKHG